jgi:hypothetical protein
MSLVRGIVVVVAMSVVRSLSPSSAAEEVQEAQPVERWSVLGMITGYHSVVHKASGFEIRVLEADGSASVAWDPVSLFVVVTNHGTADLVQRVWRVPQGVVRVRSLSPTACGVDVQVDVDKFGKDDRVVGARAATLHLCFLSPSKTLLPKLTVAGLTKHEATPGPLFVEITGTSAAFYAAALPSMEGVWFQDHATRSLGPDRWRVAVYVTSGEVVSRIRAAGLTVKVLQSAEQVREENERIDRSFGGIGGAGGPAVPAGSAANGAEGDRR